MNVRWNKQVTMAPFYSLNQWPFSKSKGEKTTIIFRARAPNISSRKYIFTPKRDHVFCALV